MLKVFDIKKSLPSILSISLIVCLAAVYFLYFSNMKKQLWTPGQMSKSHAFIEKDCKTCHVKGFNKIEDQSCKSCHSLTVHSKSHEKEFSSNCVSCHSEHGGEQKITHLEDSNCVSCHANIRNKYADIKTKNVENFLKHPEFQSIKSDNSTIKLNHALHLKPELRGAEGPTQLNCNSCHNIDKLGRRMQPIKFEQHCSSCHSLEFDERLPGKSVPHGKADIVYNYLFREYASLYLNEEKVPAEKRLIRPGNETGEIKTPEYAFRRVEEVTREIEKDLISKRGCFLCHDIKERKNIKEKKSAFIVRNPHLQKVWMKKAVFKHGSHEFASCETCHSSATKSEKTADVLMPEIKNCNSCHKEDAAPSNCLTCHSYHDSLAIDIKHKQDKFHEKTP